MSEVTFYTIDLAKRVFQLHGFTEHGRRVLKRRLSRAKLQHFFDTQARPGATVVMEACGGAHFWARWLAGRGFEPVALPAGQVKRFVSANKTDARDADALAVAYRCGQIRPVAIKTESEQQIQLLHRVRQRRMAERTRVMNQLRALLREHGIVVARGSAALRRALAEQLAPEAELGIRAQALLNDLLEEWRYLEAATARLERELAQLFRQCERCQRLAEVPGIGMITATALVAWLGDVQRFPRGRALAAWLGLTPSEHSSGEQQRLGAITKRGNTYLRTLLVHGARSAKNAAMRANDSRSRWLQRLHARRGANRASVALANKNARIIWALLAHGTRYQRSA